VSTGRLAWKLESPAPVLANVTAIAGGGVFARDLAGTLYAVDTHSGAVLLRHPLGSSLGGGLFTYALGRRQYVAVMHGPVSAFFGGGKGSTKLSLLALP
jgi:alcohol dehydrogenase (cytochrome c)